MLQGFFLLARRQARQRAAALLIFLLRAAVMLVRAGRAGLTTAIDVRTLPSADREALRRGITLRSDTELTQLLEDYS